MSPALLTESEAVPSRVTESRRYFGLLSCTNQCEFASSTSAHHRTASLPFSPGANYPPILGDSDDRIWEGNDLLFEGWKCRHGHG